MVLELEPKLDPLQRSTYVQAYPSCWWAGAISKTVGGTGVLGQPSADLEPWFSQCGLQISSLSIIREFIRNVNLESPSRLAKSENLGLKPRRGSRSLQVILINTNVWEGWSACLAFWILVCTARKGRATGRSWRIHPHKVMRDLAAWASLPRRQKWQNGGEVASPSENFGECSHFSASCWFGPWGTGDPRWNLDCREHGAVKRWGEAQPPSGGFSVPNQGTLNRRP